MAEKAEHDRAPSTAADRGAAPDRDKTPPTAADLGATPEQAPPNVVTDNSGEVLVQPVATTDPTLTDSTNPLVPFDGADPRNIPPHDSNEQLHIASEKRIGAEMGNRETAAAKRREAVKAAADNSRDVRDVLDDDRGDSDRPAAGRADASHPSASRSTPPQGRSSKPGSSSTTSASNPKN